MSEQDKSWLETPHGRPVPEGAIGRALDPEDRPEDTAEDGAWLERPHGRRVSDSTIERAMRRQDDLLPPGAETADYQEPLFSDKELGEVTLADLEVSQMHPDAERAVLIRSLRTLDERTRHLGTMVTRLTMGLIAVGFLAVGSVLV